jgi:hypothetical protein
MPPKSTTRYVLFSGCKVEVLANRGSLPFPSFTAPVQTRQDQKRPEKTRPELTRYVSVYVSHGQGKG